MPLRFRALAVLALTCALPPACANNAPLTELVVVVSADLPVPELRVLVMGPEGTVRVDQRAISPSLPLTVVLTRDHSPYGPVMVHVEGGSLISDTATELAIGERRRLDVHLTSSCLCPRCAVTETCREGACVDRHIAASMLPPWTSGRDTGVQAPLDAGGVDAGPTPDSGMSGPTCGCHAQPCCGGTMCNGTLSCRSGTCQDCVTTHPTIMGMTPRANALTGIYVIDPPPTALLYVGYTDTAGTNQTLFHVAGGVTVSGTAMFPPASVSASGSDLVIRGTAPGQTARISFPGATLSGAPFSAPATCMGRPGVLTGVSAMGSTLTFAACDGTSGAITLTSMETCQ